MKEMNLKIWLYAAVVMMLVTGCGPTAEDILKKYENHSAIEPDANQAKIFITSVSESSVIKEQYYVTINYDNPLLNGNAEYIEQLGNRLIIAGAENPLNVLPLNVGSATHTKNNLNGTSEVTFGNSPSVDKKSLKSRFVLIGFKGIGEKESSKLKTPPLFFIVELDGTKSKIVTEQPLLADSLFEIDYAETHFNSFTEPQTYSGTIDFEKSKDASLQFTLSADGKQITAIKFTAKELFLSPKNKAASSNDDKSGESIFEFSKNASAKTNISINNVGGYNMPATDANGYYVIESMIFSGGMESKKPVELLDSKILLDDGIIFDLSVADDSIFGTTQIQIHGNATKPIYAVFNNITTTL